MKDLVDVLDDIKKTTDEMEFCEDFNKLQLILNNTNQFVRSFDKIVFDSGNEPYIIEIVARLLKYFRIQNYLDGENKVNKQYETQLRKITMYMLLNTDVSFRYDLSQDSRVSHLLNSLPQMSKCLLLNCIWGLDLDRFLYEMISYSPLWFSMQFLDQAIVSLKYAKPYEVLERVESMVRAIYFAICRTDCDWRKIDRNRYVDQQRTLGRMFDFVADLLRYFNTPDVAKFEGWSKLRKHRYFGFVLKHMFSMTSECLELYFRKPAIEVGPEMGIYELVNDRHVPREALKDYSQPSENALTKINNCLLNTLETCIMHVSIDRFLYWAEIDLFKEGEEPVTLQQVIGESAYRLSEDLRTNKQIHHSIVRHLTQFAMRPKTLAEKATTMNLGMLMLKIDSAQSVDERCVYLNEFVSRSERVFGNAECLETIEQYWPLLDGSHVRLMIEYDTREPIGEDLMDEDEVPDERLKLRALILKAVDTLPAKDFHHLVTFTLDTFGTKFSRYQQPDFAEKVIELINRLRDSTCGNSLSTGELPSVQQLLFQSPASFYAKLVRSLYNASVSNEQYVEAIVAVVLRHKSIAQHFMREHMETLLTGNFEILHSPLLRQLARKLYDLGLFEPQDFIEQLLLRGISEAHAKQNSAALFDLLKLAHIVWLPFISTLAKGKDSVAIQRKLALATVLRLAEIVEGLRCNATQQLPPETDQIALVATTIELLEPTLHQLQKLASNEDKTELFAKMETQMSRSTMYYFRKHICYEPAKDAAVAKPEEGEGEAAAQSIGPKTTTPTSFASFMYEGELTPTSDSEKIKAFLTRVFPRCTRAEALALARDDMLRGHIESVAVSVMQDMLTNTSHHGWLRSCASNYIQCLLQVLLPAEQKLDTPTKHFEAVRSLVQLFAQPPQETWDRICTALGGDLASLYRYVREFAPDMPELVKLKSYLTKTEPTSTRADMTSGPKQAAEERMDVDGAPSTVTAVSTDDPPN
ncbi:uncharacterized protein LOC131291012 [Anopheles ziemanni]|uniref:uncharacterized protein LOC131269140 n=1 Tax=Anopheles coustani TaxID=139045 RepID=UPI002658B258|nr:uncharacterized protein LOC131269140 [Anopheles coustani]XP_058176186.1 uncharacterized protein LOC131291012 [Anopheles ziemanni]